MYKRQPLSRAAHTVGQLLHVAQAGGVSHARLNLRPAELGGIEIRLVSDAAGVTATVMADSPEAARLLQDAASDLRRSLERAGVQVAQLDIGTQTPAGGGPAPDGDGDGSGSRRGSGPAGAGDDAPAARTSSDTLVLPGGVLVDVLA